MGVTVSEGAPLKAMTSGAQLPLTVSSTSTSQALTVPTGAIAAFVTCETNNVRYRLDGSLPTATVGHLLSAGDPPLFLRGTAMLTNFRTISMSTAGSGLHVSYMEPAAGVNVWQE